MKILKKLKPYKVDTLLFGLDRNSSMDFQELLPLDYPVFFEKKDSLYKILERETLVHKSKIFHKSMLLNAFGFKGPMILIGDCFTHDGYRGKGIYPAVLRHILKEFIPKNNVYILVSPENIPSIRGIEKAGLRLIGRLRCLRIGPVFFKKKILNN
ncbi:MAG: GNAT family protein [Algoriphagus sp.]|nr:GNAT family protein [Algoriphagus sp.]